MEFHYQRTMSALIEFFIVNDDLILLGNFYKTTISSPGLLTSQKSALDFEPSMETLPVQVSSS